MTQPRETNQPSSDPSPRSEPRYGQRPRGAPTYGSKPSAPAEPEPTHPAPADYAKPAAPADGYAPEDPQPPSGGGYATGATGTPEAAPPANAGPLVSANKRILQ